MKDEFVIVNITAEYSLGEKIINIATWHDVLSVEFSLAKTFVKSVASRRRGTLDSKRHYINILCKYSEAKKILSDMDEELYYVNKEEMDIIIKKVNVSINGEEKELDKEVGIMESKNANEVCNEIQENTLDNRLEDKNIKKDLVAVYVVVEKGYSEDVVNIADKVGTRGATVIPAEGNKFASKHIAPGLKVNPFKEIVVIITTREKSSILVKKLSENDALMGKGKGIVFTVDILEASGINL